MNYTIEQTNKCTKAVAVLAYILFFIGACFFADGHDTLGIITMVLSVVFWLAAKIARWWDNS